MDMLVLLRSALVLIPLGQVVSPSPSASAVLGRYVQAIGGEQALRAIKTRITEGEFDNGRGLKTRYRTVEEMPNRRVTLIGTAAIGTDQGSGRGFDGNVGWDKNFIGTGLRTLEGRELADAAREADMLRPLHLLDHCATTSVTSTRDATIVACDSTAGSLVQYRFDSGSGLLIGQEVEGGRRASVRIAYEDYRAVDALRVPFVTRIDIAGATITYRVVSIVHNQAINPEIFQRPASDR